MNGLVNVAIKFTRDHAPAIFAAVAASGVVATAYLTAKAAHESAKMINEADVQEDPPEQTFERLKARTKLVWRNYIPAATTGAATIVCIFGSHKASRRRIVAATMAYSMADQMFNEYKQKVLEQYGPRKEEAIRDAIAEDRVKASPPPQELVQASGPGEVLSCEEYTGRYFISSVEKLRKAQNDLNAQLLKHDTQSLSDFYYILGLNPTQMSPFFGWFSSKLMELEFTFVLVDDKPCISFRYNYVRSLDGTDGFHGICMAD